MKVFVGFLAGALFGGVLGLLLAPSSGEDLRSRLRTEAEQQYQRAQEQMNKSMAQVQAQVDKLSSEVQEAASRAREKGAQA